MASKLRNRQGMAGKRATSSAAGKGSCKKFERKARGEHYRQGTRETGDKECDRKRE